MALFSPVTSLANLAERLTSLNCRVYLNYMSECSIGLNIKTPKGSNVELVIDQPITLEKIDRTMAEVQIITLFE